MNKDQYRTSIEKLGLTQAKAAHFLGINERTSRYYALGECAVPKPIAMLLRLMVRKKISPEYVDQEK